MTEIVRLGADIEREVGFLTELYGGSCVDQAVLDEFESTVTAYRTTPQSDIGARLELKYGGENPKAVGSVCLIDNRPVGMQFSGIKDFKDTQGVEIAGINVSAWVGKDYRGAGIGKLLIGSGVLASLEKKYCGDDIEWHNRIIWTGIARTNYASIRMCAINGFRYSQPQTEHPDSDVYTYPR